MKKIDLYSLIDGDFVDSILCGICWSEDMRNIIMTVDYFWGKDKNEILVFTFKNCNYFSYNIGKIVENCVWSNLSLMDVIAHDCSDYKKIEFYNMNPKKSILEVHCEDFTIEKSVENK